MTVSHPVQWSALMKDYVVLNTGLYLLVSVNNTQSFVLIDVSVSLSEKNGNIIILLQNTVSDECDCLFYASFV